MHNRTHERKHLGANIVHGAGDMHSMPPPGEMRPTQKLTPVQMKQKGWDSGRKK